MTDSQSVQPGVDPAPQARLPWLTRLAWPIVLLIVAAAAAYPAMMIDPPSWDSPGFKWMGRRILQGDVLYRDIWDHKFPVIHWINGLAAALGDQQTVLYLLTSVSIAATGWLISLLVRRQTGFWLVAALTALTYVTLGSMRATLAGGNFVENWAAPFVVLCLYAAVRATSGGGWIWPIASGLGLGVTACLRPPSLLVGSALLLLLPSLWRAGRLTVATVLGWFVGFAIVPAVICIWAASQGVLWLMGSLCIGYNFIYASQPAPWLTWGSVAQHIQSIVAQTWPWHLGAAIGLAALVFEWVERRNRAPGRRGGIPIGGLVVAWLVAAGVSSCFTRIFFTHYYYLVLAPMALLSAWAWRSLAGLCSRFGAVISAALFWLISAAVFAWIGHLVWMDYGEADKYRRDAAGVGQAVKFLAEHGQPTDSLYVFAWGVETDIAARLGWRCPTRHSFAGHYAALPGSLAPGGLMEQWRDDMLRSPPDWLVCGLTGDLVTGKFYRPEPGWAAQKAQDLADPVCGKFLRIYVEKARFSSGGSADNPDHCVIIYRRKQE
jgi:hypothetical protein